MSGENTKIKELKYEALAQLIAQSNEEEHRRFKDFKENFTEFKINLKGDMNDLKHYNSVQNGRFADSLERIRVLEDKDLKHIIDCPYAIRVRSLEDSDLSAKSIKRWVAKAVGITAGILTLLWSILQVIIHAL